VSATFGEQARLPEHDAGEVGGADPFHDHAGRHRACARRSPAQIHLARVPDALTGNGWPGGPQNAPGQDPSEPRRAAMHCLGTSARTVACPQNRLQMARPARRSRGAGVICNPWQFPIDRDTPILISYYCCHERKGDRRVWLRKERHD